MLFSSIVPCFKTPFFTITYALFLQFLPSHTSQLKHVLDLYSRFKSSGSSALNMSFPVRYFLPFSDLTSGIFRTKPIADTICHASSSGISRSLYVKMKHPEMWSCIPPILAPPSRGDSMFSCTFISISASAFASSP